MDSIERYRGAMTGFAAGDALGAPVKGLKAGHARELYGEIKGYVDPEIAGKLKPSSLRLKGLYTDDTQSALAIADTLIRCGRYDEKFFANLMVSMARAETGGRLGVFRGAGKNFRSSVLALADGKDPLESGLPHAGVGAMARALPIGLFSADGEDAVINAAVEQSFLTHRDPRPAVLAAVLACCAALSVSGAWDKAKPRDKMADALRVAERTEVLVEHEFIHRVPVSCMGRFGLARSGLSLLPGLIELPEKRAYNQIVAEANRQFPEHKITEPGQGFVMAAGLSALYIALTASDFEDGVREALRLGKDTDTMAAMVGGLLGARWGEDAIPREWRDGLINREQAALRGEALLARSGQGLKIKGIVEMESELTKREQAARTEFLQKLERRGGLPPRPEPKPRKAPEPESSPDVPADPAIARDRVRKRGKRDRVKAPWKK